MTWFDSIPDTLTVEHNGAQVPLRDHPMVKDSPDLGTFAKRAWDNHREVGARIPLRADNVDAWRKEHLPKLQAAGLLAAPPASPDEYAITRPDSIPDGATWNDGVAKEFAAVLHKHGVPKAAAAELLALQGKLYGNAMQVFNTAKEDGLKALKAEFADKYDERVASVQRILPKIFTKPEELEAFTKSGLANHPAFLGPLLRLAPLAEADSSFMGSGAQGGSGQTADDVRSELAKIMNDKTHPDHAGYWANDPKVMAKIDAMYKQVFGTGTVALGTGITLTPNPGA